MIKSLKYLSCRRLNDETYIDKEIRTRMIDVFVEMNSVFSNKNFSFKLKGTIKSLNNRLKVANVKKY